MKLVILNGKIIAYHKKNDDLDLSEYPSGSIFLNRSKNQIKNILSSLPTPPKKEKKIPGRRQKFIYTAKKTLIGYPLSPPEMKKAMKQTVKQRKKEKVSGIYSSTEFQEFSGRLTRLLIKGKHTWTPSEQAEVSQNENLFQRQKALKSHAKGLRAAIEAAPDPTTVDILTGWPE